MIKQDENYGLINAKGKMVVKPIYDLIYYAGEGLFKVKIGEKWGFINKSGKVIIEPVYTEVDSFDEGLALVGNQKFGYINAEGDTVIGFIYDGESAGFTNGLSDAYVNDSCGYIDKSGKVVIPFIYETCYPFLFKYAPVWTFEGEKILIDQLGDTPEYEKEIYSKYLWHWELYPGSIETGSGQGRLNTSGDTIIPPLYRTIGLISDGMYIVQAHDKKWGAYNKEGEIVINPKFEKLWHFSEGLASFCEDNKWGFINKKGEIKILPRFDRVSGFNCGF
ncbi:MAG: WG repeat-containing protein, partial [Bacteroidota bacterium]